MKGRMWGYNTCQTEFQRECKEKQQKIEEVTAEKSA